MPMRHRRRAPHGPTGRCSWWFAACRTPLPPSGSGASPPPPATLRAAVAGAGALGDPALGPWLLELMRTPALARLAGEAFTAITGADLADEDLEATVAPDHDAGPTEDPEDENVALDPDENLPWPDPARVERWWAAHRGSLPAAGTRCLLGQPVASDWLRTVLRQGRQRHRAAAALELAVRGLDGPLFEIRAPGFRQRRSLSV
jgi:uncharacterized protein (TIGR02270 family)